MILDVLYTVLRVKLEAFFGRPTWYSTLSILFEILDNISIDVSLNQAEIVYHDVSLLSDHFSVRQSMLLHLSEKLENKNVYVLITQVLSPCTDRYVSAI